MTETLRETHRGFLSDLAGLCESYGIDEIKIEDDMIVALSYNNRSSVAFAVLRDGVYIAVREQHLASEYDSQTGGEC